MFPSWCSVSGAGSDGFSQRISICAQVFISDDAQCHHCHLTPHTSTWRLVRLFRSHNLWNLHWDWWQDSLSTPNVAEIKPSIVSHLAANQTKNCSELDCSADYGRCCNHVSRSNVWIAEKKIEIVSLNSKDAGLNSGKFVLWKTRGIYFGSNCTLFSHRICTSSNGCCADKIDFTDIKPCFDFVPQNALYWWVNSGFLYAFGNWKQAGSEPDVLLVVVSKEIM